MEGLWQIIFDQRWWILIIGLVISGVVESKKISGTLLWFVIGIFLMYTSYILPYFAEILAILGILLLLDFPKWLLYPIIAIGVIWGGVKLFTACSLSTSLIIIAVVVVVVILLLCKDSIQSYFLHKKYGGRIC
jgi:hypothetical protein